MDKALLVGINRYPAAPLRGCANDISDMADFVVKRCGFAMNDVRLLADERATTSEILERLNWLVDGVSPGDRILFHYSGHGAQMATRDHQGEIDGLDEVICPVDFDWTDGHVIRDKDFSRIFASVPAGVEFVWISDSCHSGDLSKDFPPDGALWKSFPTPIDIQWRIDTAKAVGLEALTFRSAGLKPSSVALISGCQSDQTSADATFDGRPNGALTYYLLKVLQSQNALDLPLDQVIEATKKEMAKTGKYRQIPGIEGSPEIIKKPFLSKF